MQGLLDTLDRDLQYCITVEAKMKVEDVVNYSDVRAAIAQGLEALRDVPNRWADLGRCLGCEDVAVVTQPFRRLL